MGMQITTVGGGVYQPINDDLVTKFLTTIGLANNNFSVRALKYYYGNAPVVNKYSKPRVKRGYANNAVVPTSARGISNPIYTGGGKEEYEEFSVVDFFLGAEYSLAEIEEIMEKTPEMKKLTFLANLGESHLRYIFNTLNAQAILSGKGGTQQWIHATGATTGTSSIYYGAIHSNADVADAIDGSKLQKKNTFGTKVVGNYTTATKMSTIMNDIRNAKRLVSRQCGVPTPMLDVLVGNDVFGFFVDMINGMSNAKQVEKSDYTYEIVSDSEVRFGGQVFRNIDEQMDIPDPANPSSTKTIHMVDPKEIKICGPASNNLWCINNPLFKGVDTPVIAHQVTRETNFRMQEELLTIASHFLYPDTNQIGSFQGLA